MKFDIIIQGRTWYVEIMEEAAFVERFKADGPAGAFTISHTREIVFCREDLSLRVVIHELGHAYLDGACIGSAMLSVVQLEEVAVELFAIYGETIVNQGKELFSRLNETKQ